MSHDDQMRSLRLMGSDVIPAVREIGAELGLKGPFESDPGSAAETPAETSQKPASEG